MEKYLPDVYQKSIYTINYQKLKENGIKCILLDLDNTMIPAKSKTVTGKLEQLIDELKKDFKVIVFSNAIKKRVKPIAEKLALDYYAFALKPMQKYYLKALKEYRFKECEVAIIGDQIQTDILGGNRVGITTILVNPVSSKDFSFTRLNRYLEKRKMEKMCRKGLFTKGKYYD